MTGIERLKSATGLAVDFGGTKIAAARLKGGEILEQIQVPTEGNDDTRAQIDTIIDLLSRLGMTPADKVGVAVTGRVTARGYWHALNTETLPNIDAVDLRKTLSGRLGNDATVLNDATATAIGEHCAGAGQGFDTIGFITVSTGVGGGFVLNGVPLLSTTGLAGHVGFTTSRVARGRCGSGRLQTVESIASGGAIARLAAELGHETPDAKAVYQAHLAGEKWASDLIRLSANVVAELCANLKCILDPELILIGGSVGLASGYLTMVEKYLQNEPEIFRVAVKSASPGLRATYIGALVG